MSALRRRLERLEQRTPANALTWDAVRDAEHRSAARLRDRVTRALAARQGVAGPTALALSLDSAAVVAADEETCRRYALAHGHGEPGAAGLRTSLAERLTRRLRARAIAGTP